MKTTNSATIWASRHLSFTAALDLLAFRLRAQAATLLRMLILTLVGLLFVLVGLTILTGRVEVGGPIMGGVLLAGFGASQFAPRRDTKTHE